MTFDKTRHGGLGLAEVYILCVFSSFFTVVVAGSGFDSR